jgi:O-antigen/teichoic acid export membrane protein
LAAFPMLLVYSDLGFSTVFANKLAIHKFKQRPDCSTIFWTGSIIGISFSSLLSIVYMIVAYIFVLNEGSFYIFLCLTLYSIFGMQANYLVECSRSIERVHFYQCLNNSSKFIECLLVGFILYVGYDELYVAFGMVILRLFTLIFIYINISVFESLFQLQSFSFSIKLLREEFTTSLLFMLYPLSLALMVQIPIILLGSFSGGLYVALFATIRTLSRIPIQLSNILSATAWPIITKYFAIEGDTKRVDFLVRYGNYTILFLTLPMIPILFLFGDDLYSIWTRGELEFDFWLFALIYVQSIIGAVWMNVAVTFTSTNRHHFFSLFTFLAALVSLVMLSLVAKLNNIYHFASTLIMYEVVVLFYILRKYKDLK